MSDLAYGTFYMDGEPYPMQGQAALTNLTAWAPKVTQGDFSKDSDDLLSAHIDNDFSGGGQVLDLNESSDQTRFWIANAWTPDPNTLCANREVVTVSGPNADGARPLGDLRVGTDQAFYVAYGTEIRRWDETTGTLVTPTQHTLTAAPISRFIAAFAGTGSARLWIPQGSGFQTFDGSSVTAQVTTFEAIAFCVWDNKLYALASDGGLWLSLDGTSWGDMATPQTANPILTLDASQTPKGLISYHNRTGDPTLYVVSDQQVWAFDPATIKLFPTNLVFPHHPDNGKAMAVWPVGQDLYVGAGINVYRTDGSVNAEMGPGRDQGLPAKFRGSVVDLCAEHNVLYALIQGATTTVEADDTSYLEESTIYDDALYGGKSQAISSLMFWTGVGWHTAWESADASGLPSWCMVSQAKGAYRLWWGYAGDMQTIALPRDFHQPRQGFLAGIDRFQTNWYFESGYDDANMTGFVKLLSHFEVNATFADADTYVDVKYMKDFDSDWTYLGRVSSIGRTTFAFGWDAAKTFSQGLPVNRWRYRLEGHSSDPLKTALIDSLVLKFIKLPSAGASWVFNIPLMFGADEWEGRTAQEVKDDLDAILTGNRFVSFQHGPNAVTRRVRVGQVKGGDNPAEDWRGIRQISIVEVPLVQDAA